MCSDSFSYDVFLSFRGEDTRFGFTGNLYKALCNKGIHTFFDDEELRRGEEITPSLVKAIQDSRIAIIVLSKDYASSSFCLDELATILDRGLFIIPIFYNVDPSVVRHHNGSYGEALAKHEKRLKHNIDKLQKWKMALQQVSNLAGYHFKQGEYEHKFIASIVASVFEKINHPAHLHVGDYLVGLESRLAEVMKLLAVGSDDGVHIIGIYGMGGIGKSTLARAVYNKFIAEKFDGLCYLANVREKSNQHGLEHLQSLLLQKILGDKNINIASVEEGASVIKNRLLGKKVLLLLDDVDKDKQLKALLPPDTVDKDKQLKVIVERLNWLGLGSRIIITTRDEQLLKSHGIQKTYEVNELDENCALQLLKWKAFKEETVYPNYLEVLNDVVTYASGLPLALEVIGSHLFGKSIKDWQSAINQYKRIPHNEIQKILQVSFDALHEEEKSVFLDIVCCLKGYQLAEVEVMLHCLYDDSMSYHTGVLVDKSLIKIMFGTVQVHDLIQDMGREIELKQPPKEAGKRRRLWLPNHIFEVLEDNTGTREIQIIYLDVPISDKEETIEWDGNSFKKMKNLKILIIKNGNFSEGPKCLPISLRVLEWWRYPSHCLPFDFNPKNLAICTLPSGCFPSFEFDGLSKKLVNLKELNFDNCKYLEQIPDVSDLLNLEKLSFEKCENLITVHHSVGFLDKLKRLSAEGCGKLGSFPPLKLTSLEKLNLSGCGSLESFPEILGEMGNVRNLQLVNTPIKILPFSFQNLIGLQGLNLTSSKVVELPSSVLMMPELTVIILGAFKGGIQWRRQEDGAENVGSIISPKVEWLSASSCNLDDDFFSIDITSFSRVKVLDISKNNFTILPECIKELQYLKSLDVSDCKDLREIRGVPPNLKHFFATGCKSLISSSRSMFLTQELHEAQKRLFVLPGDRIPEWFDHQSSGPSISFWFRNNFPHVGGLIVGERRDHVFLRPEMFINGKVYQCSIGALPSFSELKISHTIVFDLRNSVSRVNLDEMPLKNVWNHVEVRYPTSLHIQACGIHVFKQKSNMEDVRFVDRSWKRKLDGDLHNSESHNHQLLKKRRFVNMEVSLEQLDQQQKCIVSWSCLLKWACSYFHFFLLKQSSHCIIM